MHRLCVCLFLLSQPGFGANIKSGQFLSVEGDKFMYGGEHVSAMYHLYVFYKVLC